MSKVVSTRIPDDAWQQLEAIAMEHGTGVSEHWREVLLASLDRSDSRLEFDLSTQATVPEHLTTVERHTLSTLHRILARLVEVGNPNSEELAELEYDLGRDGDRSYQLRTARVLEHGWVGEYPTIFGDVMTELPRRDSGLVMDILDMFRFLGSSLDHLAPAARTNLAESSTSALRFRGFDANDSYEGALLTYAQDLIRRGKWSMLASHFTSDFPNDAGNSHSQMVPTYRRMLDAFTPIWRDKLRGESDGPGTFDLSVDELTRVATARVHPSRR